MTDVEHNAFTVIEKVGQAVLLLWPNFSEELIIYTDSSRIELGGLITQNDNPIALYSWKLTPAKINYTTMERELLSIVETLK